MRASWLLVFVAGCGTATTMSDAGTTPDAASELDAATLVDVGADGGRASDAGTDAAPALPDANADGAACDETRVTFVPSGHLVVGQLCDDVFACPANASESARIAAIGFDCGATTEGPCTTTITCRLHPSTLDATEVQDICDVITVAAPPTVTCMIYL